MSNFAIETNDVRREWRAPELVELTLDMSNVAQGFDVGTDGDGGSTTSES